MNKTLAIVLILILTSCSASNDNQNHTTDSTNKTDEQIWQKAIDDGTFPNLDESDNLLGQDINNNGIRDDIEKWIDKAHQVPTQNKTVKNFAKDKRDCYLIN